MYLKVLIKNLENFKLKRNKLRLIMICKIEDRTENNIGRENSDSIRMRQGISEQNN
ncbi:unnamed protein product [Paramecium primaurelia]|uniref:Uncharacterized protein n=1 Tax=Paramecium primaurelia TaxID=5886 RepID=A0A8S1PA91_PARPR|nr:unnamed protein product [Paramecium primaurelia]